MPVPQCDTRQVRMKSVSLAPIRAAAAFGSHGLLADHWSQPILHNLLHRGVLGLFQGWSDDDHGYHRSGLITPGLSLHLWLSLNFCWRELHCGGPRHLAPDEPQKIVSSSVLPITNHQSRNHTTATKPQKVVSSSVLPITNHQSCNHTTGSRTGC